jgi:hypothetical protein
MGNELLCLLSGVLFNKLNCGFLINCARIIKFAKRDKFAVMPNVWAKTTYGSGNGLPFIFTYGAWKLKQF